MGSNTGKGKREQKKGCHNSVLRNSIVRYFQDNNSFLASLHGCFFALRFFNLALSDLFNSQVN